MTAPIAKRADQLVVGDRILMAHLPAYARSSDAEVFLVKRYPFHGVDWVFVAFMLDDGDHLSTSYGHDQMLRVVPAPPLGHGYSRADDGESPQPSAGREPLHTGAVTDSGLVDETPTVCSCTADPLECAAHGPSARASLAASKRLRGLVDVTEPVLIVGDTAAEQYDNAYAAYERDEAECPSAWHVSQGDKRSRCPICNEAD